VVPRAILLVFLAVLCPGWAWPAPAKPVVVTLALMEGKWLEKYTIGGDFHSARWIFKRDGTGAWSHSIMGRPLKPGDLPMSRSLDAPMEWKVLGNLLFVKVAGLRDSAGPGEPGPRLPREGIMSYRLLEVSPESLKVQSLGKRTRTTVWFKVKP